MQKLYQKSPLAFALVCIGVYVFGMSAADEFSRVLEIEKCASAVFALLCCALLFVFVKRSGTERHFGLCKSAVGAKRLGFYLPLALLTSVNFWYGVQWNTGLLETVLYVVTMLCVGFLEEMIFRGFLFRAMERDSRRAAVIVSSVTFGIGHLVNRVNGSGAAVLETLCQIVYATAAGFLFVALFVRTDSLLPCILSHGLLNATSAFSAAEQQSETVRIVVSLVLALGSAAYALYVWRALPARETENHTP
ncbi:MAG: CPBP family intramembrane metalloprotease [Clostridia bacterium]|nr:CPBP family intramembrane metalloprotease [Clostridia bacterium]